MGEDGSIKRVKYEAFYHYSLHDLILFYFEKERFYLI
jgi:hypothetical protein